MQTATLLCELADGRFTRFCDLQSGENLLPPDQPAPLLTVRVDGQDHSPTRMRWRQPESLVALDYEAIGVTAEVRIQVKPTHLALELTALSPVEDVELVTWGPYPTVLDEIIGETVGVVQGCGYALGIQALNVRTLGGMPVGEADIAPTRTVFAADLKDIPEQEAEQVLLRGNTAERQPGGSRLAAYCRERRHPRTIANWSMERHEVPAFPDGGVIGSRIAIFGTPAAQALEVIGEIEQAEGLPHPLLDGQWAKTSPAATASYLIVDFAEDTCDEAIALARRAGLHYLYHSAPFRTWGHFELKDDTFPHGWDGFRTCVERAATQGIHLGIHTLSNFITTNDAYVTPVPDPRLARRGTTALAAAIDAGQTELIVADPTFVQPPTTLNAILVDQELIRFKKVSETPPWTLLGCQRGAWGTAPAAHARNAAVGRLIDHPYEVFLTDAELSREVAARIAAFCNHTGARQLSFDGLEGNFSTGLGDYGTALFTQAWYDRLAPHLQGRIINDASMPGHYTWHTYTRMNWGEPWYAGFRESQTRYRLQNQRYFRRNLMPPMLGWFALRADTTLEDVEWLLARAAGFDAGFALATSMEFCGDQIRSTAVAEGGPATELEQILNAVRAWETARMAGAFPQELKLALQDIEQEFHLQARAEGGWSLYPVSSLKQRVQTRGELLVLDNPYAAQPLDLAVRNAGETPVTSLCLQLDDRSVDLIDGELPPGATLRCRSDARLTIRTADGRRLTEAAVPPGSLQVANGITRIALHWLAPETPVSLAMEGRTLGPPRTLNRVHPG